jgi:hypothetical protein
MWHVGISSRIDHNPSWRRCAAYSMSNSVCSKNRFKSILTEKLCCGLLVFVGLVGLTEDKQSSLFRMPLVNFIVLYKISDHLYFHFLDIHST